MIWGQLSVRAVLPETAMALWQYASAIHGRVSVCAVASSLDIEGVSIPLRIRKADEDSPARHTRGFSTSRYVVDYSAYSPFSMLN